jgi:hypothetical protein
MACNCKKNKTVVKEKETIENLLFDPKSGETNISEEFFLPIKRDIWLGTPSDDHEVDIDSLMDQARVFISVQNHPVKQTYTIPVGNPEPKKSFKEKIKSFFKL